MHELHRDEDLRAVLVSARTVAVLGAHVQRRKPAHYVPAYLHGQGYRIVPVNPRFEGRTLWGETVRANLADVDEPVDVVDVFRRSEHLSGHVDEILAMRARPDVVWFQQGIRDDAAAARLLDAGIDVVQDACMLAMHKRLGLEAPGPA